jgi:hypothetical protein
MDMRTTTIPIVRDVKKQVVAAFVFVIIVFVIDRIRSPRVSINNNVHVHWGVGLLHRHFVSCPVDTWFEYEMDDARIRDDRVRRMVPLSLIDHPAPENWAALAERENVVVPDILKSPHAKRIVFTWKHVHMGMTSAFRHVLYMLHAAAVTNRTFSMSSGWHYDAKSEWTTFFEPFTNHNGACAASDDECLNLGQLKSAGQYWIPPHDDIEMYRMLGMSHESQNTSSNMRAFHVYRNLTMATLWRPNAMLRDRVRNLVCDDSRMAAIKLRTFAVFHFRRGDKLLLEARDPPPIRIYLREAYRRDITVAFVLTDDFRVIGELQQLAHTDHKAGNGTIRHLVSLEKEYELGHMDHGSTPVDRVNATDGVERFLVELEIARHAALVVGDARSNVVGWISFISEHASSEKCGNHTTNMYSLSLCNDRFVDAHAIDVAERSSRDNG